MDQAPTTDGSVAGPGGSNVGVVHVLRQPAVARILGLAMLARLPLGAIALLLLLRVTGAGANYAEAGALGGCFGAALGVGQPLLSRFVDRRGQPPVLFASGLAAAFGFVALAATPADAPLPVWFVLAAFTGFVQPPVGGAMRGLWTLLLSRDDERHAAFALDASAFEIVFTVGPLLLVGVIATLLGASVALLVGAVLVGTATALIAKTPHAKAWRPEPHVGRRSSVGALRAPGIRTILLVYLGLGGCFGAIEVAIAAFGRAHGSTTLIGVLLAVWSFGSVLGGLVLAGRRPAADPARRLLGLMAILAITNAGLGVLHAVWSLGLMLVVAGVWVAPIFATASAMLSDLAAPGTLTEAFGWTVTATTIGMTVMAPVSGHLIDTFSPSLAMAAAAVPVALAGTVVWLRRRTLQPAVIPT